MLYHLQERGIEWVQLDHAHINTVMTMAYSPLGQAEILDDESLIEIAGQHDVSAAAIALAWVLRKREMITIPKAASLEHVRANAAALDVVLSPDELKALDRAFPPPTGPSPLAML